MPQILHHPPAGQIIERGFEDPVPVSFIIRLWPCQDLRLRDCELRTARCADFTGELLVREHEAPGVVHGVLDD